MTQPKTNECTGACCASFTLKHGAKRRLKNSPDTEKQYIGEMLKYIGPDPDPELVGSHNYTCKHWNEETKLCDAYEDRPSMCSRYPYDGICGVCGLVGPEVKDLSKAPAAWCCSRHKFELTAAEAKL